MALIGINPGSGERPRKLSTLEQIALGVDMASKVLGGGLTAYKTLGPDAAETRAKTKLYEAQAESAPGDKDLDRQLKAAQIKYYGESKPVELQQKQLETAKLKRELEKPVISPAELEVDKKFADQYADFRAAGGYADILKNLESVREIRKEVAGKGRVTGPLIGLQPKAILDITNPQAADIQDRFEEVIQRNLRAIFGPQFTEKEGTRLIQRAYNPSLPEEANLKRIDRLLKSMEEAARAKQDAAEYYEQHGTLKGFKGKIASSIDDILPEPAITPDQPGLAPSGPKIGEVMDGYQFTGGNPKDPKAWKKVMP